MRPYVHSLRTNHHRKDGQMRLRDIIVHLVLQHVSPFQTNTKNSIEVQDDIQPPMDPPGYERMIDRLLSSTYWTVRYTSPLLKKGRDRMCRQLRTAPFYFSTTVKPSENGKECKRKKFSDSQSMIQFMASGDNRGKTYRHV